MTLMRLLIVLCLSFAAQVARAQSYCVTKNGAYLRKSASVRAPISWQVPKYMPLMGTGKRQGGYVEVKDVDNQTHWAAQSEVTTGATCLVVKVRTSRLRLGPGRSFQASPLGIADRYTAFADLGGEEGWTQIQDEDGEKAWISLDNIWKANKKARVSFEGT